MFNDPRSLIIERTVQQANTLMAETVHKQGNDLKHPVCVAQGKNLALQMETIVRGLGVTDPFFKISYAYS